MSVLSLLRVALRSTLRTKRLIRAVVLTLGMGIALVIDPLVAIRAL